MNGYRFFLIDTRGKDAHQAAQALEGTLGDYGFDAETSAQRLAAFFAVQNTYLSTFQSLGGLGLLLGTFALAAVQLRSVLERRGELALMRAAGFRRAWLARMVMIENALLLTTGLASGIVAALVAVLPFWLAGGAAVPWASLAATLDSCSSSACWPGSSPCEPCCMPSCYRRCARSSSRVRSCAAQPRSARATRAVRRLPLARARIPACAKAPPAAKLNSRRSTS